MHRRVLLDWLRRSGDLQIYVGKAPASFVAGLRLSDEDRLHSSFRSWVSSISLRPRSRPIVAFNPGEMTLGRRRALREAALSPLVQGVRAAGGEVLRIGIAAGNDWSFEGRFSERVIKRSVHASTLVAWREEKSAELFGGGAVIPDLAFALGSHVGHQPQDLRRPGTLAVTMRFDRPTPSQAWIAAIRGVARRLNLEIVVTSQVRRDNPRSKLLADKLGGRLDPWEESRSHAEQEFHVRALYADSRCIVSDRLHALIAASTEGAVPIALLTKGASKIGSHFKVIGLDVGCDTASMTQEQIEAHVDLALAYSSQTFAKVNLALGRLDRFSRTLDEQLNGAPIGPRDSQA